MKIFTTLFGAALVLASAVYAQSPSDHMTVNFNTSVMVGETKLPAGACDIQVLHGSSDNIIVVLRSKAGPYTAAVASRLHEGYTDTEGSTSVVLNRVGNEVHLSRILLADHSGYQLNNIE